jgi:hypothetical protein
LWNSLKDDIVGARKERSADARPEEERPCLRIFIRVNRTAIFLCKEVGNIRELYQKATGE